MSLLPINITSLIQKKETSVYARAIIRPLSYVAALATIALALAVAPRAVTAQGNDGFGNPQFVAVVVKIPVPSGVPHDKVIELMKATVPDYQHLAGLVRKYFTISDDNQFGGIYLFENRSAADNHFDAAWFAAVQKRFGAKADVTFFSAPFQIEGQSLTR